VWRSVVASWASKKMHLPVEFVAPAPPPTAAALPDVRNGSSSDASNDTAPTGRVSNGTGSSSVDGGLSSPLDAFVTMYRHHDSWAPYTQIIWDYTYLLGCGFSYYKDDAVGGYTQLYVCNYGPA
jgi:hypothetical protein